MSSTCDMVISRQKRKVSQNHSRSSRGCIDLTYRLVFKLFHSFVRQGRGQKREGITMEICFGYDPAKATQVVLWLVHKHLGPLDKLKLVKLVFYADRQHLARYGRPIVGGCYYAMPNGPVSSELLDCIQDSAGGENPAFELTDLKVRAKMSPDEEFLSESDIEVLEETDEEFGKLDPWHLRNMTHKLKAWKKNKPLPKGRRPLPYEDFFLDLDVRNKSMLALIREDQELRTAFD